MRLKTTLFLLITLALVCSAYATDINSCQVISSPGTYILTQDIHYTGTSSCINITARDVLLTCNNHRMTGDAATATAVREFEIANVTVANCFFQGFYYGVYSESGGSFDVRNAMEENNTFNYTGTCASHSCNWYGNFTFRNNIVSHAGTAVGYYLCRNDMVMTGNNISSTGTILSKYGINPINFSNNYVVNTTWYLFSDLNEGAQVIEMKNNVLINCFYSDGWTEMYQFTYSDISNNYIYNYPHIQLRYAGNNFYNNQIINTPLAIDGWNQNVYNNTFSGMNYWYYPDGQIFFLGGINSTITNNTFKDSPLPAISLRGENNTIGTNTFMNVAKSIDVRTESQNFLSNSPYSVQGSSSGVSWNGLSGAFKSLAASTGDGFVSVNATTSPLLNSSATVTLGIIGHCPATIYYLPQYAASLSTIVSQGQICNATTSPACTNIICSGSSVTFNVPHFDSYGAEGDTNVPEFNMFTILIVAITAMTAIFLSRKQHL